MRTGQPALSWDSLDDLGNQIASSPLRDVVANGMVVAALCSLWRYGEGNWPNIAAILVLFFGLRILLIWPQAAKYYRTHWVILTCQSWHFVLG